MIKAPQTDQLNKSFFKFDNLLTLFFFMCTGLCAFAQPANDLICNATTVSCGSSVSGTTIGATNTGTAEANFCGGWNQNTPGVWYKFVGNGNLVTFSLCATAHDSQIAVFTGACAAPSCYGANDDSGPACTGLSSSFALNTVSGVNYWIKVFSWTTFTPQFAFTLNVTCTVPPVPPANDQICNAITVACGSSTAGTTVGATNFGAGEVATCGNYAQNTPGVWYKIVGNGTIFTASLCGTAHDSQLAVYSGDCNAPVCITSNDDNGPACAGIASSLAWSTTAGVTYWIKVWSWTTTTPTFNFTLNMICQAGPPNDNCANATQITVPFNSGVSTTANATNDAPANAQCGPGQNANVWYTVVGNGATYQATTCNAGTAFDTEIQVFSGSCGAFTFVTCADIANTTTPCASACETVSWCSNPGTVYYISVGSGNQASCTGSFELSVVAVGVSTSSVLENGDFLWRGPGPANSTGTPNTNDRWDVLTNWLVYDSINVVFTAATVLPDLTTNVFIPPVATTGGCTFNYPRIYGTFAAQCQDITILQGARLEFMPVTGVYGSLSVKRNWMNSGQTRCVATATSTTGGTVKFVGTNNQTISNAPATPTANGVNNFFNMELNNTGQNTGVILDFPATNYVYVANDLKMIRGHLLTSNVNRLVLGFSGLTSLWNAYPSSTTSLASFANPTQATVTWTQGSVIGPMWRWYKNTPLTDANSLYPFGNIAATSVINRNARMRYPVGAGTAQYIKGEFFSSAPPALTGLPLTDGSVTLGMLAAEGYWEFLPFTTLATTTASTTATATYEVDLRANQFGFLSNDFASSRIVKAPGQTPTSWVLNGTHGAITGTFGDFRITRTGLTGFSFFTVAVPSTTSLAVEFLGAYVNCNDEGLELSWATASEWNSHYFVVQSSPNGEIWTDETELTAAGNSNNQQNYRTFLNKELNNQYLRILEVDMDGLETVLTILAVDCDQDQQIKTYPNPSSDGFNLVIDDERLFGTADITMYASNGLVVKATKQVDVNKGMNSYYFDTAGLVPGMYYIQITSGDNTYMVKHSLR